MNIELNAVFWVGAMLSGVGILTLLLRKNLIVMLMGLELVLLGGLLALTGAARVHPDGGAWGAGLLLVFWALIVGASEVALGLALILKHHALRKSVWVDEVTGDE